MMLRFRFTFFDRENTSSCYLQLKSLDTIVQALQVANEFETKVLPITECQLGDAHVKLKVLGNIPGRPLETSDVFNQVVYLCKDNQISGSFKIPSAPASFYDESGSYTGMRIFYKLDQVNPLVQEIFATLPGMCRPDGAPFPQNLIVGGRLRM